MPMHWLMKSEPETFSFVDLKQRKKTLWDGVRNYQARNFMMQDMKVGDKVLFYHSSCEVPGVAGLAEVTAPAQPDPTQFDPKSDYHDPKATKTKPIWFCVEVGNPQDLKRPITLPEIRGTKELQGMLLLKKGQRLSIQPVTAKEYEILIKLSNKPAP